MDDSDSSAEKLPGRVTKVNPRSGVVEFTLAGGVKSKARFGRQTCLLDGAPLPKVINLDEALAPGRFCFVSKIQENKCIYDNECGVFYYATVCVKEKMQKVPVLAKTQKVPVLKKIQKIPDLLKMQKVYPGSNCIGKQKAGIVIKLQSYKEAKIPRVVASNIAQSCHYIFIRKSDVKLNGKKVKNFEPKQLPVCKIGMKVIVSITSQYSSNNCTLLGQVDISVLMKSISAVDLASIITDYESGLSEALQTGVEKRVSNDNKSSTDNEGQYVGVVMTVMNCKVGAIPRVVLVKLDGIDHHVFLHSSNVLLNGVKLKKCLPHVIPKCSIGDELLVTDLQPYTANSCTYAGRTDMNSLMKVTSQHQLPSDKALSWRTVSTENNQSGSSCSPSSSDYVEWTAIEGPSQMVSAAAVQPPDLGAIQLAMKDGFEKDHRSTDTRVTTNSTSVFETASSLLPPGKRGYTQESVETQSSIICQLTKKKHHGSACSLPAFTIKTSPCTPRHEQNDNFKSVRVLNSPLLGSTDFINNQQAHFKKDDSTCLSPGTHINDAPNIGVPVLSQITNTIVAEEEPSTSTILTRDKPKELQKFLDYCKTTLKMSSTCDENVYCRRKVTVDQGTQTISTGEIATIGIYPG